MKKWIKAVALAMAAASVLTLGACKKPAEDPDAALKEDVLLNNFEGWAPDLQLARFMNGFGKISLNSDSQYVSKGEKSARLDPLGWTGAGSLPLVYFPTKSDTFQFDYSDFSYVDYVSFDIYNANGEEKTMNAGLVSKVTSIESINRVCDQEFTLQPGWNTCTIQVEASVLAITADITDIKGVYFMFENAHSLNVTEDTPKYYLDNIMLVKKDEKSSTEFEIILRENEIADFELLYQQYMVANDNPSTVEVVNAAEYGLVAPSGNKVLRVVLNGVNTGYWKYFRISEVLIQATKLNGMSEAAAQNAYICFETYNNTDSAVNFPLDFTRASDGKAFLSTSNNCAPKQWTSYEYKITDILKEEPNFLKDPGQFLLNYKDDSSVDREFFFDNFRIEFRN